MFFKKRHPASFNGKEKRMLDYSKAALKQVESDFKMLVHLLTLSGLVTYLIYIVYALVTNAGEGWINITLGAATLSYLVYYLTCYYITGVDSDSRRVGKSYKVFKLAMKAISLLTAIYGIYNTAGRVSAVSVIITSLMVVVWILQVLFELVSYFVRTRLRLIVEGLEADFENMIKPLTAARDFARKIVGKPVAEKKTPSKLRVFLDEKVKIIRERRAEEKREKKREKLPRPKDQEVIEGEFEEIEAPK